MAQWDVFREEVKRQRVTQEWVAQKAGMSLNTLQGKITKDREPYLGEALRISKILRVPVQVLFPELDPDAGNQDTWMDTHRALIADLKILPPDKLDDMAVQIHAVAERVREELGKASDSRNA